jgi:hypothetical protein
MMSPKTAHKLTTFIASAARLSLADLARTHLMMGEELLETEDGASALAQRALINCIDAIGKVRFPLTWEAARNSAGYRQDVA